MDAFCVRGPVRLSGELDVAGAKNSALKLLAAALLAPGTSVVRNVPAIADMRAMRDVISHLGAAVTIRGDQYRIEVPDDLGHETPAHLVRSLRASICVLGPVLARTGRVHLAQPGGCNLGHRGIDMHLAGLEAMGAHVRVLDEAVEAECDQLVGADIELPFASVGATENLLMAAVMARGTTTIANAAREPEIADLATFLRAMGAEITGAGTDTITVRGVPELGPTDHAVVGDRILGGTFAAAAAVTGGDVIVHGVDPAHLRLPLAKLRAAGAEVTESDDAIAVRAGQLRATDLVTLPYPGFPTDLQPQFMLLLSQARGSSLVTENVFDGRLAVTAELQRMGADLEVSGHHVVVRGSSPLRGAQVRATDLRAGAALVLAGLVAQGETVVTDPWHVDRGYADLAADLRQLGADVRRTHVQAVGAA